MSNQLAPVLYLPLNTISNGNVNGISTQGDTVACTAEGGPQVVQDNKFGNVMEFDGVDDQILLPTSFFPTGNEITISLWAKGADAQPINNSVIGAKDSNGNKLLNVHLPWSDGNVYFDCGNAGTACDRMYKMAQSSEYKGQWHHWVFTKNAAAGEMTIYLDGQVWHVPYGTRTRVLSSAQSFVLGSEVNGNYYSGQVAHLRVYNKALSLEQVQAVFDADQQPLVLYLALDSITDGKVTDAKGGQYTVNGGAQVVADSQFGNVVEFGGINGNISLPAPLFPTGNEMTISLWAKGGDAQPKQSSIIGAEDSNGNRIANVHLPWSDGIVYYDAGHSGATYDRINKAAQPSEYKGEWHHWAFTKNVATGEMKIYLDGQVWHSGTGMTKALSPAASFVLGSCMGLYYYSGRIAHFKVRNKVQSQQEIQNDMAANNPVSGPVSGTYENIANQIKIRLDVDRDYAQNYMSFTYGATVHDIGPVTALGNGTWEITSLEHLGSQVINGMTKIRVQYANGALQADLLRNDGSSIWSGNITHKSDYFRDVEIEFDYEAGVNPITSLNPHNVDNHHPGSVPNAAITVTDTFAKAGINIIQNANNNNAVPTAGAGGNSSWNNAELHDSMQAQWSKNEAAQWAAWVFQADKHDDDHSGIMFDSIGNFQRCGTALFHGQSGYTGAPAGVVNRHKFVTLIHEMGHSFNLYHSWIKTSGTNWKDSVVNEAEARSYMNYPDRVAAGYYGFFDTFDYRFSDQELTFLRHAPEGMVQPGGSAWGDDHAGSGVDISQAIETGGESGTQELELIIRSNKAKPVYEYLELVNLEIKLKNVSDKDQKVPQGILDDLAHMNIRIRRNGGSANVFKPYATPCEKEDPMAVLKPGESLYGSLFLSAGKFGWTVSEPGVYQVSVGIHSHSGDAHTDVSTLPYSFVVAEPGQVGRQQRKEREILAQDVFTDEVGRTLAMGGTKYLTAANEVLQELTERFPASKAAKHAAVALALPNMREGYKLLTINKDGSKKVAGQKADEKAGNQAIKKALVDGGQEAIETLGNIAFQKVSDKVAKDLKNAGDDAGAKQVQKNVLTTLDKRGVKLPANVKKELQKKAKG